MVWCSAISDERGHENPKILADLLPSLNLISKRKGAGLQKRKRVGGLGNKENRLERNLSLSQVFFLLWGGGERIIKEIIDK